jgi:cell filamentation protein
MDKYDTSKNDPYCYKGTSVLKNKLNIRDLNSLEEAEREITSKTIMSIKYKEPPYDLFYLKSLHYQLFSKLYDWAGDLRIVNIYKNNTPFCFYENIENESNKLFSQLKSEQWLRNLEKNIFCEKLARYYCEFNMIHPFREGNGRVQRLFFKHLALSNRYLLDWSKIDRKEWIQANIDGVDVNYKPMENIFKKITTYL